jgi:hypothetical protein
VQHVALVLQAAGIERGRVIADRLLGDRLAAHLRMVEISASRCAL